jgi:MscS family membrane protein
MEAITGDFYQILQTEAEIDPNSIHVFFRDYSASSLDLWIVYVARDPDFTKHMRLRQRMNLAMMRAVQARGLSFAYPTQTLELSTKTTKALAQR